MYCTDDDTPSLKHPFMILFFFFWGLVCVLVALVTGDALFFGGAAICGLMSLATLVAAIHHDTWVEQQKRGRDDTR